MYPPNIYNRLEVNSPLRIHLFDMLPGKQDYESRVIGIGADGIRVAIPKERGRLVPISVGSLLTASFTRDDALYLFDSEVIGYQKEPTPFLLLSSRKLLVRRIQRRDHFRLKTSILVKCRSLRNPEREGIKWTRDISGQGGFLLDFSPDEVKVGERLQLRIFLSRDRDPLTLTGEVTRLAELRGNRYGVGVKFLSLDEESQDALVRSLYEIDQIQRGMHPDALIGESPKMRELYELINNAAKSESTVMIQGESGTGKELVARAIHYSSPRSGYPFIPVNCGSIVETLLESELFGHKKGSFTGAVADHRGIFKSAEGGTVFLDEVVEIKPALQVKLLRSLQEREIRPVGSSKKEKIDVRIVAATNRNIERAVLDGTLREDFFYRLYVIPITVPPLRERKEDIPLLVDHFIRILSHRAKRQVAGITPQALELFLAYNWPGNVRELENTIERVIALGKGELIGVEDIPRQITKAKGGAVSVPNLPTLKESERDLIRKTLEYVKGNKSRAARILDIDRKTLYRKIKEYGLADSP